MEKDRRGQVMDAESLDRALTRIAHQITEHNRDLREVRLLGIRTRGVPLARRLSDKLLALTGVSVPVGELDISSHRDDRAPGAPPPRDLTAVPFPVEGRVVILVDDVICTGRTARAAMEAVTELGRPARIQLCELIDRGHAELPIRSTYVGKNIPTSTTQVVSVRLSETDGETSVWISENTENRRGKEKV